MALAGRRVLEIADEKGLYCGKLLADMGADVIKIERPGGDSTRMIAPFWQDQPHPNHSLYFLYMNTNKRSVTLNINQSDGQAILKRLAKTADVVVETFQPGHLDNLGLGYAALREIKPDLIFTSITGFGQTGPYKNHQSSDIVASALGGAMHCIGDEHDPPVRLAGGQANITASTYAAVSTLIALHYRTMTGKGQQVDISMEDAIASVAHMCGVSKWLEDDIIPKRLGTGLFAVPCGTYRCKDGLVYILATVASHWKSLAHWIYEVTDIEDVINPMFEGPTAVRIPYRDLLDFYVTELTSSMTMKEVFHEAQRRHITVTPVNTAEEVVHDAHLAARQYFIDLEHPGTGTITYPGAPFRHSLTPWKVRLVAPGIGEHNQEILGEELGISSARQRALDAAGII